MDTWFGYKTIVLKDSKLVEFSQTSSPSKAKPINQMKHMGYEKPSAIVLKAIREQVEGSDPSSETRSKIADLLSLRTNQELLIHYRIYLHDKNWKQLSHVLLLIIESKKKLTSL